MFLVCFGLSWLVGFGLLVGWLLLFMGCLWVVYGLFMGLRCLPYCLLWFLMVPNGVVEFWGAWLCLWRLGWFGLCSPLCHVFPFDKVLV